MQQPEHLGPCNEYPVTKPHGSHPARFYPVVYCLFCDFEAFHEFLDCIIRLFFYRITFVCHILTFSQTDGRRIENLDYQFIEQEGQLFLLAGATPLRVLAITRTPFGLAIVECQQQYCSANGGSWMSVFVLTLEEYFAATGLLLSG